MTYKRYRIVVFRASKGTCGVTDFIGEAYFNIKTVKLGTRTTQIRGNGCPSQYIEYTEKDIDCVTIGGTDYIVGPVSNKYPKAYGQVTIHHDNRAVFIEKFNASEAIELI